MLIAMVWSLRTILNSLRAMATTAVSVERRLVILESSPLRGQELSRKVFTPAQMGVD